MQKSGDGSYVVSLVIPAEPRWLALSRLVLSGLCQLGRVDEETLADLKLAVTERARTPSASYGEDGSGWIEVHDRFPPDELSVEVADGGQGSRFDRVPDSPLRDPTEELREDEMGLAIIHALVDDVEIGAGPEGHGQAPAPQGPPPAGLC